MFLHNLLNVLVQVANKMRLLTLWPLFRKRTILSERPPLVGEVNIKSHKTTLRKEFDILCYANEAASWTISHADSCVITKLLNGTYNTLLVFIRQWEIDGICSVRMSTLLKRVLIRGVDRLTCFNCPA
jgi:hypothetical protein